MSKFWTLYIGFTLAYIILVFIPSLAMILVVKNNCISDHHTKGMVKMAMILVVKNNRISDHHTKGMVKIEVWMIKQKTVFGICFLDKISRS